jgi:phage tail sheath protein FI
MTVTSYPGVYVEELPSGVRPIEAAGTSTAAFFGVADRGPIGEVVRIFSFDEFQQTYGSFRTDGQFLAHAVFQFFNNGGKDCYVGRVATGHATASVTIRDRGATQRSALVLSAVSPGAWGNALSVQISSQAAQPNVFQLKVEGEELDPDTGGQTTRFVTYEVHADLSMDPADPRYVEAIVNGASRYVRVQSLDNLPTNVAQANVENGYSESGLISGADGGADFIAPAQRKLRINVDGDGWRTVDITEAMTRGRRANDLTDIAAALKEVIAALPQIHASTPADAYARADVQIETPDATKPAERKLKLISGTKRIASSFAILPAEDPPPPEPSTSLVGALFLGSKWPGAVEAKGAWRMRPMDSAGGDRYLLGDDTIDADRVADIRPGRDGDTPVPAEYANAFHWLDGITDVSLIAVPGVGSFFVADRGMAYCRNRPLSDCFFIADMPSHYDTLEDAQRYVTDIETPNSYGAVYFPWLTMPDPTGASPSPIAVPPSGFVAGMYAQIDARRGVWKAPAGLEAALVGAVGMTADITDQQQGILNLPPKSVCVIRKLQGSGIVLWGARTLSTDAEYKYVPIRRTAIMLRKSIYAGIQWAVFEGNDERLWSALRLNIESFMNGLFRAGAFQGSKASDAYFVRCGLGDTMTQGDIDRGQVIVLVGFAPLKPAEFVVVRIQQKVGQDA